METISNKHIVIMTFHRKGGRPSSFSRRQHSRPSRGGGRGNNNRRPAEEIAIEKYTKIAQPVKIEAYTPKEMFDTMGIHKEIVQSLVRKGYTQPSPIQDQAIPHVLQGKDVIGLAATGTGKTAAFLIPLLHKTLEKNSKTSTLIVCPTRELASQIEQELYELKTRDMNVFATLLVGGVDIRGQIRRLRMENQFIIGTPGRIKDLIQKNILKLNTFESVVLDEVDRMLDMGFLDDVQFIVDQLPAERQSLFFSATVDPKQAAIINKLTRDPITVQVAQMGKSSDNVHQNALLIEPHMNKYQSLVEILRQKEVEKVIIFCKTKHGTERLGKNLQNDGFPAGYIHGDLSQGQRKRALDSFKNNNILALVATDVAARGIDVKDVSHVINFDEPMTYDEYIHRIGRTGRAGKTGNAITFVEKRNR